MKLLILTQKVDREDPTLGFFCAWIEEFSKHFEKVSVVCLEEGSHSLPMNVSVYSLGKEAGTSKLTQIARFYRYIWSLRGEYDRVFVHMNPEYIVLGGALWKLMNKKIGLWYVHRAVNMKLRIAAAFADAIFTSSAESFRIQSSKVHYLGHGIDIDKFPRVPFASPARARLVHLGRISRIKNIDTILRAAKLLADRGIEIESIDLAGEAITSEDRIYENELRVLAQELGIREKVRINNAREDRDIFTPESISINAAPDGGMDKAVLGSLAAEKPAFAANRAFKAVFGEYADTFMYSYRDPESLAQKIEGFLQDPEGVHKVRRLSERVRKEFNMGALIQKIARLLV